MKWKVLVVLAASLSGCEDGVSMPGETQDPGSLPERMEFVTIPSGEFIMGSPASQEGRSDNEGPPRRVTVEAFELMSTPVTWSMWLEVMGEDSEAGHHAEGNLADHPVTGVSWRETWHFMERLHTIDPDHIYRLPSEAEWEYACRAGTDTRFFWGDSDDPDVMDRYCWYWGNSGRSTRPVGEKEPNPWGLMDMSGNVYEWCHDSWYDNYEGAPGDGTPREHSESPFRVVRGGSWRMDPHRCRSAFRFSYLDTVTGFDLGFRVARVSAP